MLVPALSRRHDLSGDQLPKEVCDFTGPNPRSGGSGRDRSGWRL